VGERRALVNMPAMASQTNIAERFGRLLSYHRRRRGMSQQELADRSDLSTNMISKLETGKTGISFPGLNALANALDVDVGQLFVTGAGDEKLRGPFVDLTAKLAALSENDLIWIGGIIDAALASRRSA
jgi:transcriptional regulator with XRE-family HTH domain